MTTDLVSALDPGKPVYNGRELLLIENYLNSETCRQLISFADRNVAFPAPVGDVSRGYGQVANTQDTRFTAERIELPHIEQRTLMIELVSYVYRNCIDPHYGIETEWFEYRTS